MKTFHLEILTPQRVFYSGECVSLSVPITDGMLGLMANRAPITASLVCGEAHFTKPDGEKVVFSISGGMVDAEYNRVELLCDSALLPEEVDEDTERQKLEQARSEMAKKQSKRDYLLSRLMLNDAINNLKVKEKKNIN